MRSPSVTVVQTCALPISTWPVPSNSAPLVGSLQALELVRKAVIPVPGNVGPTSSVSGRSEERRVGKEGRSGWAPKQNDRKIERSVGERGQNQPVATTSTT